MKPSAVLLIDLENFYISRIQHFNEKAVPPASRPSFAQDFERLIAFAQRMVGTPFAVRRAYADYFTLRAEPRELMRQGVEPVQVFRLTGGRSGSKNAADMRMAMDATALLGSAQHAEHFVLVTGDADFIPVILELKRHGRAVSVIGVTGATSELIQRFVDNFELFEDLIAAEEVEVRGGATALTGDGIEKVAAAIRQILGRNRPLRFAAVKPLLSKELDYPFDPGAFGCDTTGDFLRRYETALGVAIRQGQHDSEIDLPGVPPPSANGNGSKTVRVPSRQPERPVARGPVPTSTPQPHTTSHYRLLLAGRGLSKSGRVAVRIPAVPWSVFTWACDAVVALLAPPTGEPTHTTKLLPKLLKAAEGFTTPEQLDHLRLFYPTLRAGLPVQGADGIYALPAASGDQIRRSVLGYVAYVLATRLSESRVPGAIRADVLAAVFEPGAELERVTAELTAVLARPTPDAAPEPTPIPQAQPHGDELHTAAGYMKLLKNGGARGTPTESFKALPVPWQSVERVCADVFPIVAPVEGAEPHTRDRLTSRLTESGKDSYIENYEQHVRRALGILRISGDLSEENGVITLNPEVTSAADLRFRTLGFLLQLLQLRLEEREVYDPIRPLAFVTALEAGSMTDTLVAEVARIIAWLYQAASGEAELAAEPTEMTAESRARDDNQVSALACVDAQAIEPITAESATDPNSTPAPATHFDVAPTIEESDRDAQTFDGVLPEAEPPRPNRTEPEPESAMAVESPSAIFGTVDVAVLTSEAVAAAQGPASDPVVPLEEPTPDDCPKPTDEEILTAVPVADWLPEGDPLFSTIELPEPPAPPPVAKINSQHPPDVPPPETA